MQINIFDQTKYDEKLKELFVRFPSVQKQGFGGAYKPGLQHMMDFCAALGHPEESLRAVHVAGTNGKGSTASMITSALAACGHRTGLYTSPHILDFRERMRIVGQDGVTLVPKEWVWDFILRYEHTFDELDLSFFEITTGMAFKWFADEGVDRAVIEVGLGGRLDSTNVITPEVTVITSIGLDHCALLGDTRSLIAHEKAGIFKKNVPAVAGQLDDETRPVFEQDAAAAGCTITFAETGEPTLWDSREQMLPRMDLQGHWQEYNLRTALTALDIIEPGFPREEVQSALERTAARTDFHGRWEMISRCPDVLCDIGHNPPALKANFAQLQEYLDNGRYSSLTIVYGVMADKDLDGILPLMPHEASLVLVAPDTPRALPVGQLEERVLAYRSKAGLPVDNVRTAASVTDGIRLATSSAPIDGLVYIGGSTFVVSEAATYFE